MTALAHDPREQSGEVARTGADVGDPPARLNLGEGQHLGRMTQGIALDLISWSQGVGDGGLIGGRRSVLGERRSAAQKNGGDGGGEQMRFHGELLDLLLPRSGPGRHKARG
ncbi:hypothetical protein D3C73_1162930 [compost metagenome]